VDIVHGVLLFVVSEPAAYRRRSQQYNPSENPFSSHLYIQTEMGEDQRSSSVDSRHQMGTMNATMKVFTRVPPSANVTPSGLEMPWTE